MRGTLSKKEVDFSMVREDYCRYQLEDGTLVKVKMCVLKIAERRPGAWRVPKICVPS